MKKLIFDEITTQFYQIGAGRVLPVPAPSPNPLAFLLYLLRRRLGWIPEDAMPPAPPRSAGGNLTFTADLYTPDKVKVGSSHAFLMIVTDSRTVFTPSPNPPFFGDIKRTRPESPVAWASWQQTLLFDDGSLQLAGLLEQHSFEAFQPASCAVIGGTGKYLGARGQAVATQIVFPHTARLEIELLD